MSQVTTRQLRARFAQQLSSLYGTEVPAYDTLVRVSHEVNARVLRRAGTDAERLGSIGRVTAERHGAIRVGTRSELEQASRFFGALGMYPTGFYDLRESRPQPIPVVATAFRPIERDELAFNPFRVFTSVLVSDDRRFFDADLQRRLETFLGRRQLFPRRLVELADKAADHAGLEPSDASEFLALARAAFALSTDPVDAAWYAELESVSSVAADIGGVTTTHVNHLTPRVLDIDDLYRQMQARGITMIDTIQGPPRSGGPDVLLRQTSFRALAEPRRIRKPDGTVVTGDLRVRFGEVESRGVAVTPAGRDLYERLMALTDERLAVGGGASRQDVAEQVWSESMPSTDQALARSDLAYYTFTVNKRRERDGRTPGHNLADLLDQGWLDYEPIVYEDFLPRSAAGIFSSNLTSTGQLNTSQGGAARDPGWLSDAIGREVNDPEEIYATARRASLDRVASELGLRNGIDVTPPGRAATLTSPTSRS